MRGEGRDRMEEARNSAGVRGMQLHVVHDYYVSKIRLMEVLRTNLVGTKILQVFGLEVQLRYICDFTRGIPSFC